MPSKAKEKASQKLAKAKGRVRRQLFASTLSWKPLTKCTCLGDGRINPNFPGTHG